MARRTRPLLLLLLALVSGGGAAYVALRYLRERATPLMATEPPRRKAVVALRPLPMGAIVTEQDVKTIDWSGGVLPTGYFGSTQEVVGRGLIKAKLPVVDQADPVFQYRLESGISGLALDWYSRGWQIVEGSTMKLEERA